MKSNRTASHAVWLPILIGSALALSKTKNCVVYLTTPHSPARSLNLHSLDTSLHHAVKSLVFCKLQSYGASSQEGLPCTDFSTPHRKILRLIKMVFDDILPARQVKQTRHWHDLHSRHTCTCVTPPHSWGLVTYDVTDLEKFPVSPEVMLFFLSRVRIYVFWLFSH